MTTIHTM